MGCVSICAISRRASGPAGLENFPGVSRTVTDKTITGHPKANPPRTNHTRAPSCSTNKPGARATFKMRTNSVLLVENVTQLRALFWRTHDSLPCHRYKSGNPRPQNDQPTDTRVAFVEFVDQLKRNGEISDKLAQSATL